MDTEDGNLTDYVSQYPYLWDKGEKFYKNKGMRENAWKTIASLLRQRISRKFIQYSLVQPETCNL